MQIDALIVGGGITGLWLRALLKQHHRSVLLIESAALGSGQTIASQGILHSGAKYCTQPKHAEEQVLVPDVMSFAWDRHLRGQSVPDLSHTTIVCRETLYWNSEGPLPQCLHDWFRRHPLAEVPRTSIPQVLGPGQSEVLCCREISLSPASLLDNLAGSDRRDLFSVPPGSVQWNINGPGDVDSVTLTARHGGARLHLAPRSVYFTAGLGNAALRESVGLPGEAAMQRRPLQMGLVRGDLPVLCGHWFDALGPRLSISTQITSDGCTIWQLGGRLAEHGVTDSPADFVRRARREVQAALPGLDLFETQWSSYRAERAEPVVPEGTGRSVHDAVRMEGNVITIWPVKLSLTPHVMIDLRRALERRGVNRPSPLNLPEWLRPEVAIPPWEGALQWSADRQPASAD